MQLLMIFLILYFILFIVMIYTLICGNTSFHRDGIIGKLYRFITFSIPRGFSSCCRKILPKCCLSDENDIDGPNSKFKYLTVGFFYLIYVFFSCAFIFIGYKHIPEFMPHPLFHQIFVILVLPWPWVIVMIFQIIDPDRITPTNVASYLELYPYDYILYGPRMCASLNIPIVPRSRYCRKYDHYCPWVLAPIGARTHLLFILFLLSDILSAAYYGYMDFSYLRYVLNRNLKYARWTDSKLENFVVCGMILIEREPLLLGSCLALWVIVISLVSFVLLQFKDISKNVTTVERGKFEDLQEQWKRKHNTTPVVNKYDKGFIGNWKEFLFPPVPEEREAWKPRDPVVEAPPNDISEEEEEEDYVPKLKEE